MRILIACECSGRVRSAFRRRGFDAWSCDVKPAEDCGPHIQCDVLEVLDDGWDAMIAHPECRYLCSSGLHWNTRRPERALETAKAVDFALRLWNAPIPRKALENSVGRLSSVIGEPTQIIQPHQFGEDASKATCLWLDGLPALRGTANFPPRIVEWPPGSGKLRKRWSNQTDSGQNRLAPSDTRSAERARTYAGIADAMGEQWGDFLLELGRAPVAKQAALQFEARAA